MKNDTCPLAACRMEWRLSLVASWTSATAVGDEWGLGAEFWLAPFGVSLSCGSFVRPLRSAPATGELQSAVMT